MPPLTLGETSSTCSAGLMLSAVSSCRLYVSCLSYSFTMLVSVRSVNSRSCCLNDLSVYPLPVDFLELLLRVIQHCPPP
eukprot:6735187-Heterocapsa_arctica.AAC.1